MLDNAVQQSVWRFPQLCLDLYSRNICTESGEEKKWGFYPTSPVWCSHKCLFPPALQQLQLFLYSYMFVRHDSTARTPSFCPLPSLWPCPWSPANRNSALQPSSPCNPPISCFPICFWTAAYSWASKKEDNWVACFGEKCKQNKRKKLKQLIEMARQCPMEGISVFQKKVGNSFSSSCNSSEGTEQLYQKTTWSNCTPTLHPATTAPETKSEFGKHLPGLIIWFTKSLRGFKGPQTVGLLVGITVWINGMPYPPAGASVTALSKTSLDLLINIIRK